MSNKWIVALMSSAATIAVFLSVMVGISVYSFPEPASQNGKIAPDDDYVDNGNAVGIKVHGNWELNVRDRDGTLVQQRMFENALDSFGPETLVKLLAGDTTIENWQVNLVGGVCAIQCIISEPSETANYASQFKTLSVEMLGSKAEGNPRLVLKGSVIAEADASVDRVLVYTDLPNDDNSGAQFSSKTLGSDAVAVQIGQTIDITITYTFS